MKTARILFALAFALVIVPFVSGTAHAGSLSQLTNAVDTMADPRPSVSTTHTFTFTLDSTISGWNMKMARLQFCKEPFGNDGTCTKPDNLGLASVQGSLSSTGTNIAAGTYGLAAHADTNVDFTLTGGTDLNTTTAFTIQLAQVTNNGIADCTNHDNSAGTCYVRIYLCSTAVTAECNAAAGTNSVQAQTIVSYTVVTDISVSARVDPSFTFVVSGMGAETNMTNAAVSTTVASGYNTLPFGHLTPGTVKYAAHKLTVTMNTTAGYTVTMKMRDDMTGVYTDNNIDPYAGSGATWKAPAVWAHPAVTNAANVDSGWIGANVHAPSTTANTYPEGWKPGVGESQGKWGPVNSTENAVMYKNTSDNGLSPTFVTYAIDVNVNQPSDTYTGYLVYNALPTY